VFLDALEEELAPLIEAQEIKHVDTYDEQVTKARDGAKELSWIHLLGNKQYIISYTRQVYIYICFTFSLYKHKKFCLDL